MFSDWYDPDAKIIFPTRLKMYEKQCRYGMPYGN